MQIPAKVIYFLGGVTMRERVDKPKINQKVKHSEFFGVLWNEKVSGVYKVTNTINGKSYIGKSKDIRQRWIKHSYVNETKRRINLLTRAIRKYGVENFTFEILAEAEGSELSYLELFYIKEYNTTVTGYNIVGAYQSHEVKSKIYLDDNLRKSILKDLSECELTYKEIADKYGYSEPTIRSVNAGTHYSFEGVEFPIRENSDNHDLLIRKGLAKPSKSPSLTKEQKEKVQYQKRLDEFCTILKENPDIESLTKEYPNLDFSDPKNHLLFLADLYSFTKIGELYNVSDNAIRKRLRNYGLSTKSKDYAQKIFKKERSEKGRNMPRLQRSVRALDKSSREVVREFSSIAEAHRWLNKPTNGHIHHCLSGERKSAYGYIWEHTD